MGPNSVVEWNAFQFPTDLGSASGDQDKQSTELRNAAGFAERNQTAKTAKTRMDIGSPTRARTWDLRINSPSLYQLSYRGIDAGAGL